jgi:hypothetical protein
MRASTIERPAVHPNSVRRWRGADLIHTVCDVEGPVAGPWEIGSGQDFGLIARSLRTCAVRARVVRGTLDVADALLGSSLDLEVLVTDVSCRVAFNARVTRVESDNSWYADGTMTTASGSRPVSLRLRYNGVFCQRGRQPSLWLTMQANVDLSHMGVGVGNWRARRLKIAAGLNLNPAF